MTLSKLIIEALTEKAEDNSHCPSNIFNMSIFKLEEAGYKKLSSNEEIRDGDLLQMSKDAGSKDILWGIINNSKTYRKLIRRSEVGQSVMYRQFIS